MTRGTTFPSSTTSPCKKARCSSQPGSAEQCRPGVDSKLLPCTLSLQLSALCEHYKLWLQLYAQGSC